MDSDEGSAGSRCQKVFLFGTAFRAPWPDTDHDCVRSCLMVIVVVDGDGSDGSDSSDGSDNGDVWDVASATKKYITHCCC